ncbi:hypothetical protein BJX70DRAFT_403306 [Aspergillus crustosus]
MKLSLSLALLPFLFSGALAKFGNCKCQDPSGTGPQWNDITEKCCLEGDDGGGGCGSNVFMGGSNQCTAQFGTICFEQEKFDACCKNRGVSAGAFCW